jgi:hypothetical protein
MGVNSSEKLVANFFKVQGNVFYFKRILAELKMGFVQKIYN